MINSNSRKSCADRPIFIVGHARGGSTVLAAMLCWHSHIGPKPSPISEFSNVQNFIEAVLDSKRHMEFSKQLEQKPLWFEYVKDQQVFTDMGREMSAGADCLSEADAALLKEKLFEGPFINQEEIPLESFLENRFGNFYKKSERNEELALIKKQR